MLDFILSDKSTVTVSIQLVSLARREKFFLLLKLTTKTGFHSISFSCEKRVVSVCFDGKEKVINVSIQLVSLARRELYDCLRIRTSASVSIQLVSLARRELQLVMVASFASHVSIQLVSLARREKKL